MFILGQTDEIKMINHDQVSFYLIIYFLNKNEIKFLITNS